MFPDTAVNRMTVITYVTHLQGITMELSNDHDSDNFIILKELIIIIVN